MNKIKSADAEIQGVKSHLYNILYLRCMNMIQNSK